MFHLDASFWTFSVFLARSCRLSLAVSVSRRAHGCVDVSTNCLTNCLVVPMSPWLGWCHGYNLSLQVVWPKFSSLNE